MNICIYVNIYIYKYNYISIYIYVYIYICVPWFSCENTCQFTSLSRRGTPWSSSPYRGHPLQPWATSCCCPGDLKIEDTAQ